MDLEHLQKGASIAEAIRFTEKLIDDYIIEFPTDEPRITLMRAQLKQAKQSLKEKREKDALIAIGAIAFMGGHEKVREVINSDDDLEIEKRRAWKVASLDGK